MKYFKYYISTFTILSAAYICTLGKFFPLAFFIGFSSFIILGDLLLKNDDKKYDYKYTFFLNLPIYLNLPLLLLFLMIVVFVLGNSNSSAFSNFFLNILNIDLLHLKETISAYDKISLVALTSLFIGIMGTVPGHELSHRIKEKFDLFIGNWLLSLSWDCAFAIEHVYGHHKNVGLIEDPATAKRGENIYSFVLCAIIKEQIDAWKIEIERLKHKSLSVFGFQNKLLRGYCRSSLIAGLSFLVGGLNGLFIFLLCAFIAKSLLEAINYIEHYGLIRVAGEKVMPRHSWNSNSVMSSIYLYNVTRHSAHHEKAYLKFWELNPYHNAPMMPYGYLAMLYMTIFTPFYFQKIMSKKLIEWDELFASVEEKKIVRDHF
jgi:hypothetical protein